MREFAHRSKQKETCQPDMHQQGKASGIPNSALEAVMTGQARASSEMMGHRQDLAPSLAAKMSKAFGMDLSQVQVYRSGAMKGTETQGMASGNKIVLSKDIDLNTITGQAVLGHEISHVRAQSQGIGMGNTGLYQNAGLEHQADVEGMMAARGQSILGESTGMEMGLGMGGIGGLTPLGAGMNASAGAPMQAKGKGKGSKQAAPKPKKAPKAKTLSYKDVIAPLMANENDMNIGAFNEIQKKKGLTQGLGNFETEGEKALRDENAIAAETQKLTNKKGKYASTGKLGNAYIARLYGELMGIGAYSTEDEMSAFTENLAKDNTEEAQKFSKQKAFENLKAKELKFGKLLEQMDPLDLLNNGGQKGFAALLSSGLQMRDASEGITGALSEEDEKRYKELEGYFQDYHTNLVLMNSGALSEEEFRNRHAEWLKNHRGVIQNGPSMDKKQLSAYKKALKKKK